MLAATYTQGETFSVEEIPAPQIADDEILLQISAASICGTDLKIVRCGHRRLAPRQRVVLGHEFVGVIAATGSRVQRYEVGQRVGIVPNAGCGHCDACVRGRSNYCPDHTALGVNCDGGQAPLVRIPPRFVTQGNILPLPNSVSDTEAALLEPFSCVVSGVRSSQVGLGDNVVIYGAGPIGLMHVMVCRLAGAARVIVVDPVADRLAKARELGCDLTLVPGEHDVPARLRDETGGRGVDVVITACAVPDVQPEAVSVLAPFGRLCLFGGLHTDDQPVPLDTNAIHYQNLRVTGTTGGSIEDYRIALRLVAARRVNLASIVSNVFALDDLQNAYDLALNGADGKVVLVAENS